MRKRSQLLKYITADFIFSGLMWLVFNMIRFREIGHYYGFNDFFYYISSPQVLKGQIFVPFFWLLLSYYSGYYNRPLGKSRLDEFLASFWTSLLGTFVLFFVIVLNDLPPNEYIYYRLFTALFFLSFLFTYFPRLIITQIAVRKIRRRQWTVNTLIIGNGEKAGLVTHMLQQPVDAVAYHIVDYVGSENVKDLSSLIREKQVSEIIVAIDSKDDSDLLKILYSLYQYQLPIKVPLSNHKLLTGGIRVQSITGVPLVDLSANKMSESAKNIKNTADIIVAILALVILSPLYLYLAIRVKLDSKGPVIFRQERIGYMGKPFTIYKFRTMREDAEKEGPLLSSGSDRRVTDFGRFMRKYRLDELPQLWNILKGDMSLVGPRPEREYYIRQIVRKAPWFYLLHNVKPGLTSWGMVRYGYAKTVDEMVERIEYDIIYYENMSLLVDLKILIYTVRTIFMGRGV